MFKKIFGRIARSERGWGWTALWNRLDVGTFDGRFEAGIALFGLCLDLSVEPATKNPTGKTDHQVKLQARWETGDRGTVHCAACGHCYEMIHGPKQGYRCASVVYERDGYHYIQGGYGSTLIDMQVYRFVAEPAPHMRDADPLCDTCIQRLIDDRDVVKHGEIVGSELAVDLDEHIDLDDDGGWKLPS